MGNSSDIRENFVALHATSITFATYRNLGRSDSINLASWVAHTESDKEGGNGSHSEGVVYNKELSEGV